MWEPWLSSQCFFRTICCYDALSNLQRFDIICLWIYDWLLILSQIRFTGCFFHDHSWAAFGMTRCLVSRPQRTLQSNHVEIHVSTHSWWTIIRHTMVSIPVHWGVQQQTQLFSSLIWDFKTNIESEKNLLFIFTCQSLFAYHMSYIYIYLCLCIYMYIYRSYYTIVYHIWILDDCLFKVAR